MILPLGIRHKSKADLAFYILLLGLALVVLYAGIAPLLTGNSHHGPSAVKSHTSQTHQGHTH